MLQCDFGTQIKFLLLLFRGSTVVVVVLSLYSAISRTPHPCYDEGRRAPRREGNSFFTPFHTLHKTALSFSASFFLHLEVFSPSPQDLSNATLTGKEGESMS